MGLTLDNTNSIVVAGIRCMDEGTREHYDAFNSTAERKVVCAWGDRYALINAVCPGATSIAGVYVFGSQAYPDNSALYPQKFDIEGVGPLSPGPNGLVAYKWARITFFYSTYKGGDPQGYTELDFCKNIITLPRAGDGGPCLETVDESGGDPRPVTQQDMPGIPLSVVTFVRGLRNVANLPVEAIQNAGTNPVNSAPFMGYAAGTVMFDGGRASRQTISNQGTGITSNTTGLFNYGSNAQTVFNGIWDVEYRFIARPGLPWDFLPYYHDDHTFAGFRRARYKATAGLPSNNQSFIGRTDLNTLLTANTGVSFNQI